MEIILILPVLALTIVLVYLVTGMRSKIKELSDELDIALRIEAANERAKLMEERIDQILNKLYKDGK